MVRARLHVICGNCGCNDEFEYKINKNFIDHGDGTFDDDVTISCRNCSTIHCLSDNADLPKEKVK